MKYYTICRNPIKRTELIRLAIKAGYKAYKDGQNQIYTPFVYQKSYPAQEFFVLAIRDDIIHVGGGAYEAFLLNANYVYVRPEQFKEIFLAEIREKEVKEIKQKTNNLKTEGKLKSIKYTLNNVTKELIITTTYQLK